jgi:hypothetical protein
VPVEGQDSDAAARRLTGGGWLIELVRRRPRDARSGRGSHLEGLRSREVVVDVLLRDAAHVDEFGVQPVTHVVADPTEARHSGVDLGVAQPISSK